MKQAVFLNPLSNKSEPLAFGQEVKRKCSGCPGQIPGQAEDALIRFKIQGQIFPSRISILDDHFMLCIKHKIR